MNPAVWKAIPIDMVRYLPYLRVEIVTIGETIMAMEVEAAYEKASR